MSIDDEVREASSQFYAGLNRMVAGDPSALADVWSHGAGVTTMHPIGGRQVGWDEVRESFEQVSQLVSGGKVELKDQLIQVTGDVACESGCEQGDLMLAGEPVTIEHRVTNVYQREGGTWKMVHHHTDTSPAMMAVLRRLESSPGQAGG